MEIHPFFPWEEGIQKAPEKREEKVHRRCTDFFINSSFRRRQAPVGYFDPMGMSKVRVHFSSGLRVHFGKTGRDGCSLVGFLLCVLEKVFFLENLVHSKCPQQFEVDDIPLL